MLKYIGATSQGKMLASQDVIISGVFGMWTSAVTSAGILHFQRFQGVLVYLVNSSNSSLVNLLALVSAPATFGLFAYPLSFLIAGLLNGFHFVELKPEYYIFILLFWLSAMAVTYFIAELFLLTKNAFVYEELFVTPLMILSGLFSINNSNIGFFERLGDFIPISFPVRILTGVVSFSYLSCFWWLLVLISWLVLAYLLFRGLIYKIRIQGEVEAM
jgi:ABC-2 type transport system permease protein